MVWSKNVIFFIFLTFFFSQKIDEKKNYIKIARKSFEKVKLNI